MDTKRVVIGVLLAMAVVLGWDMFITYLGHKQGWQNRPQPIATTQPNAPADAQPATSPATRATIASGPTSMSAGVHVVQEDVPLRIITLGSAMVKDPDHVMALNLTNRGAAIDSVVLNQFHQAVKDQNLYTFQKPYPGVLAEDYSLAATSVVVNGTMVNLANKNWKLETQSGPGHLATYILDIAGDAEPLLRIRKTFEVYKRQETRDSSKGYEISVRYSLENLSKNSLSAKLLFNGPTVPPRESDRSDDRQLLVGYEVANRIALKAHSLSEFSQSKPSLDLTKGDKDAPFRWAGTGSAYFDAIVLPEDPNQFAKVQAVALNPQETDAQLHQVALTFETTDLSIASGNKTDVALSVFVGPKWRELLKTSYYEDFPRSYSQTLVISGGPCAWCTFAWLIDILVWLLAAFHWLFGGFVGHGDWGLAIIALVLLVRLILHPISKKSQVNMMQMGKLGPEIERLKKKYADDKDELNKAMMQLYKEQGFTPILGCLPMLLQMPIWIALWSSLQSTFELRQAPFLWGFTWIHDLAKPDMLISWKTPIPLFITNLTEINLLPLLLGVVFYLQQKYTPKPVAATPEQEQQQKMMQWMSLLFPVMLYYGPSGLNLYIFTSTAIGIWESKIIRKHIKEREEAEKAGKVFIEAKATRSGKRLRQDGGEEVKKKGGLMGWLADLQEKAEKMRDQQDRKKEK